MKPPPQSEIITVLGQRGTGKTTWVRNRLPELPRFVLWDTLGEYVENYEITQDIEGFFSYMSHNQNGVFRVIHNSLDEEEFEIFCLIAGSVGNCYVIIEEVDTYATPSICPYQLRKLLKIGRHLGISMIFVSRRPAEINRLITSQSQRFVLFKIIEPNDIRYLRSIIGSAADELPHLEVLHYLDWKHGVIEKGRVHFG